MDNKPEDFVDIEVSKQKKDSILNPSPQQQKQQQQPPPPPQQQQPQQPQKQ